MADKKQAHTVTHTNTGKGEGGVGEGGSGGEGDGGGGGVGEGGGGEGGGGEGSTLSERRPSPSGSLRLEAGLAIVSHFSLFFEGGEGGEKARKNARTARAGETFLQIGIFLQFFYSRARPGQQIRSSTH